MKDKKKERQHNFLNINKNRIKYKIRAFEKFDYV